MILEEFIKDAREKFPKIEFKKKSESSYMKFLSVLLRIVTLGKANRFMTDFTTTIGYTIYTSAGWSDMTEGARIRILAHELVHFKQLQRWGSVLFFLLYMILPLPLFFAYFRRNFEMEAYEETMRMISQSHGVDYLKNKKFRNAMIEHFTMADYGWMWVIRSDIEKWYDGVVAKLEKAE